MPAAHAIDVLLKVSSFLFSSYQASINIWWVSFNLPLKKSVLQVLIWITSRKVYFLLFWEYHRYRCCRDPVLGLDLRELLQLILSCCFCLSLICIFLFLNELFAIIYIRFGKSAFIIFLPFCQTQPNARSISCSIIPVVFLRSIACAVREGAVFFWTSCPKNPRIMGL